MVQLWDDETSRSVRTRYKSGLVAEKIKTRSFLAHFKVKNCVSDISPAFRI